MKDSIVALYLNRIEALVFNIVMRLKYGILHTDTKRLKVACEEETFGKIVPVMAQATSKKSNLVKKAPFARSTPTPNTGAKRSLDSGERKGDKPASKRAPMPRSVKLGINKAAAKAEEKEARAQSEAKAAYRAVYTEMSRDTIEMISALPKCDQFDARENIMATSAKESVAATKLAEHVTKLAEVLKVEVAGGGPRISDTAIGYITELPEIPPLVQKKINTYKTQGKICWEIVCEGYDSVCGDAGNEFYP